VSDATPNLSYGEPLADDAVAPSIGLSVLHLFVSTTPALDREAVVAAVKAVESAGGQVVAAAMLGHKCDAAFMALHPDWRELRRLQSALQSAGLGVVDSYVSLTEVSEYAAGMPEEHLRHRLYPQLPPAGKPAFCFYPMSKRRTQGANWFTLPYDERRDLMHEHGRSGRSFAGRVLQVVTGSTGLDDFEWGVTLFAVHPDDLKQVVYTMRFDQASAVYAEFGRFYVGVVTPVDELVTALPSP
jgi:chlorite dismutase